MSASLLPLAFPAARTPPAEHSKPARPVATLPILGQPKARDPFIRLAILSLGLHALAVLGALIWPAEPPMTPAQPEPITLIALPPMAQPIPPVAPPQATPAPPRPAPPEPVTKPIVKSATKPVTKPVVKPAPTPQPVPRPTAPEVSESSESPSHSTWSESTAVPPGRPSSEADALAPVAIDLGAAYRLNPAPEYPPLALRRGWQGTVRLRVTLDPEGHPTQVSLAASSGYPMLDDAALAAVSRWQFRPATRLGKPVAATVEVPIVFRINR
ncbi:MAG TPA: energy transducer TonB [Candidatus Macondimonas sp.]|nr:energy transducer TonB [Candidatus Macondimonas sp.]